MNKKSALRKKNFQPLAIKDIVRIALLAVMMRGIFQFSKFFLSEPYTLWYFNITKGTWGNRVSRFYPLKHLKRILIAN